MKILFYCHVFYPQNTGYANAFLNLIKAIIDNNPGFEITVLTPFPLGDFPEISKERLSIVRLERPSKIKYIGYFINDIIYARRTDALMKEGNFDLLFVETFDQCVYLSALSKQTINKTVVRIHSTNETEYTYFGKAYEFILRRFLIKYFIINRIKFITSTNSYHIEFAKKFYLESNQIDIANKIFYVIPNTVAPPLVVRKNNSKIDGGIKVLLLGRMDELGINQKGFVDFAFALNCLPDNILNNFSFDIVGSGVKADKIKKLLYKYNNVKFIDKLTHDEVINKMCTTDFILLPSRYEGHSMFALEGLFTQNACLFSKVGGLIDMVEDNGLFFEPQNIDSIVASLIKVSSLSRSEIAAMQANSLSIYNKRFSPTVVADKFTNFMNLVRQYNANS